MGQEVLICRPRPEDAAVGDWADVLRELPISVVDWMEHLQVEGVRGADLVFACIGPALEIFSRYTKVETADGREVALAEYLEKVWEVVGRGALAQVLGTAEAKVLNGAAGAFEEDARLTALFLWTLQSTNGEAEDSASDEGEDEEPSDSCDRGGPFDPRKQGSSRFWTTGGTWDQAPDHHGGQRSGVLWTGPGRVGAQTRREIGLYPAGQTSGECKHRKHQRETPGGMSQLHWFNTIEEAKEKIEAWRLDYNDHRPHSALNDQTPSEFAENFDLSRAVEKAGF